MPFADVVVVPRAAVARKADALSFEDAACLGTPGVAAWNALVDKARLRAGQTVLVNGCTGAVGLAAVQLAVIVGATVTGTCSEDAARQAQAVGVTEVLDYRRTDLDRLDRRFDVALDAATTMTVAAGNR